MTHNEIFGNAKWIMPKQDLTSAVFRRIFSLEKPSARIIICGLGYFELYINGKKVSSDLLVPAYSDYIPRNRERMNLNYPISDKMDNRIYCLEYDISSYVTDGDNALGIMLGGGYFHQYDRQAEGNMDYGNIRLCYRIISENEEYISDETTLYQQGFIKKSSLFYGEIHDYNGFDYSWNTVFARKEGWEASVLCEGMEDIPMYIQKCAGDKITRTLKPVKIKDFGDYSVYDAGENISGYVRAKCENEGETVKMRFAEVIDEDKNLNFFTIGYNQQVPEDEFITDGRTTVLYPRFLWHGFRYFSVTNNAVPVDVKEVHTDIAVTSEFECSDEVINWLYKTYLHTQLSNIHSAVPSDCPHRERLGYTGDGQLCAPAGMLCFDSQELYKKWIDDIIDCQDKTTGHVQHTAPFAGGGGGPAGWGGAIISVIYHYTKYFGDKSVLEKYYHNMILFTDYMESRCVDGLIVKEEDKGWCLGDWCTPEKTAIPEDFVNTCMYTEQLEMLARCADLLGKSTSKIEKLIKAHRNAINKKYPPDSKGSFLQGLQGADLFAYSCKAGSEKTLKSAEKKYRELKCFDTGIFGTYRACEAFMKFGDGDVAVEMLRSREKNHSFGHMMDSDATTIWEDWDGSNSNSHPMFGACVKALIEYILGIRQSRHSYGYERVVIAPTKSNILTYAKGYITTVKGKISVEYHKTDRNIEFVIDICGGVNAAELKYDGNRYPLFEGTNRIVI